MQNSVLIKGYRAHQNLSAHQIVMLNSTNQLTPATSKSALSIGVTSELSTTQNAIADVILSGIAEVTLASTVVTGASLTAANNGTATTASSPCRIIGMALKAGVNGDRIPVLLAQSQLA